jgi:hypothetical protein
MDKKLGDEAKTLIASELNVTSIENLAKVENLGSGAKHI